MKNRMDLKEKIGVSALDARVIIDKLEAVRSKFKPGYTVKYTGNGHNHIRNKIGVVKYVTISATGNVRVVVNYEGNDYNNFLPPEDVSVVNLKKQNKEELLMKNRMNWEKKLDKNTMPFDTKIVLDEYDRKAAELEAVRSKFKPGDIVKYIGYSYDWFRNKTGVVKYVKLSAAGDIFVSVKYEDEKHDHLFSPKVLSVINSKKQIKSEFSIKKVIFNKPATIVFWEDGAKTVVKCGKRDAFDYEKGIAMAIAKKALGNTNSYYKEIKKFLPKEEEVKETKENPYGGTNYAALSDAIKGLVNSIFEVDHEDYS